MDASEFKNYILGLIFYRYLSENLQSRANKLLEEDKNVIIVGGTGLYIKALLYDYEFKNEEFSSNYDELSNEEVTWDDINALFNT